LLATVGCSYDCRHGDVIWGGLVTGVALVGVGVPLIVIGSKSEPHRVASVAPWATPRSAGLQLRLTL
jgi:hypothetical protein